MQRPSIFRLLPCAALVIISLAFAQQTDPIAEILVHEYPQPQATSSETPARRYGTDSSQSSVDQSTQNQIAKTLDLIARPNDIWVRIRNGFAIPNIDSQLVTEKQAWFLSHGQSLQRTIMRSSRYLYHVVDELEKRGMPTELALLPFIESAYNPMAYSSAHASGMWQFIPSTGKTYNLKQNWWQDERRDVLASTDAALTYLQAIYEMHGDWHLALASYNWGENAVKRAMERNAVMGLPTDYLSLRMPEETRNYVPKLQALKNIIANPELYGITLPKIENQPYFAAINTIQGMDVTTAAKLAEMSLDEFKALNPSFNRPVIPGSSNITLLLPTDRIEVFENNLENRSGSLVTWQSYNAKKGESLSKIAQRFGMRLAYLQQINGMNAKSRLKRNTVLLVQNSNKKYEDDYSFNFAEQSNALPYKTSTPVKKLLARKTAQNKKMASNKMTRQSVGKNAVARKPASRIAATMKKETTR